VKIYFNPIYFRMALTSHR